MRKYRIGVILPGVGVINRGAERFLLELTERLKDKYDITIFCRKEINSYCKRIWVIPRDNKITNFIYRIPIIKKILSWLCLDPLSIEWLTANISGFMKLYKGNFDIIISLSMVWGAISCRILRLLKKIPFIVIQKTIYCRWERWSALQRPDLYIALTQTVEKKLVTKIKGLKSICVPCAVDMQKFSPDITEKYVPFNLEKPIFLSAGALEPLKRMNLVIKAVSKLKKGSVLIIGNGRLKNELEKLGKKLLGNERFLLTSASFSEMPKYYNYCDIFTLASIFEGFGNVYLEAMACNKPIVTLRDETREEVIKDAGILCNCLDIEEYASALDKAYHTDFKDKPRKRAEQFSWNEIAKKYNEIFQKLILESKNHV